MEILITNDDGWGSDGILLLTRLMLPLGHVTVLAPDGPRSGMSNAISSTALMNLKKIPTPEDMQGADIYVTNGTPSDCVKLAVNVLFDGESDRIDLVVSGINHGSNAAINIIYSGTMGAVFVAAEQGIPAIGFSIYDMDAHPDFGPMQDYIAPLVKQLYEQGMQPRQCYNINAPKGPIVGIKHTRQCRSHWAKEIVPAALPNGEQGYRMTGYLVNDEPEATDTDEWALAHGYLSVQCCSIDMTYHGTV